MVSKVNLAKIKLELETWKKSFKPIKLTRNKKNKKRNSSKSIIIIIIFWHYKNTCGGDTISF